MSKFNIEKIIKGSKKNFERTWIETSKQLPRDTSIELPKEGRYHPFRETVQKCREALYNLGFSEIENKTILPDTDVYKQYGPESPVILDRAFYLAKLPRPEVGLSKERIAKTEKIIGKFDSKKLQELLRSYKKGEIEGDDFIEEFVITLKIKTEQATEILDKVFSEFKNLKPEPTEQTLRSHMSATWYHTLSALQDKRSYPIALFSVGPRYRNEQREDRGHLRVHHSASYVVMDPNMSLEAGKEVTLEFLVGLGFENAKFETKKATSKYYADKQEEEVFVEINNKWLEIGDIGMYSVISLANFGIKHPVFNAGFGVERLAMVTEDVDDVRELIYPQFYTHTFTNREIENSISFVKNPSTAKGYVIAEKIEEILRKYKDEIAPCEYTVFEDDEVKVRVVEKEEGKNLLGPAALNEIYVEEGSILSRVESKQDKDELKYIKGITLGVAAQIEENLSKGKKQDTIRIRMARSLSDINLQIPDRVQDYITGEHKRIKVGGPVFLTVEYLKKQGQGKNI